MAVKKVSWRRSNQALSLLFFLLVPTYVFSADSEGTVSRLGMRLPSGVPEAALGGASATSADAAADSTAETDDLFARPLTVDQTRTYQSHGRSWDQMMEAYHDAPEDARMIVDHLKKPLDPEWRSAIFLGPPGSAKSTTALAIPHAANWYFDFVSAPALLGSFRNQAKERLMRILRSAIADKRKTVVIVDELHKLLEYHDRSSHDSGATGAYLWSVLDDQARNENFFLIGTMDRDSGIEDPLKHRLHGTTIEFSPVTELVKQRRIFKSQIARNPDLILDPACDDAFFDLCIESLADEGVTITPRDFQNVRLKLARETHEEGSSERVRAVKPEHIRAAVAYVADRHAKSTLGKESLTDEEWRDFNMVQGRIIDIKFQCAHKVHAGFNFGISGDSSQVGFSLGRPAGLDMDEAIEILERELAPHQIALYKRVMKRDALIERGYFDRFKRKCRLAASDALVRSGAGAALNSVLSDS